MDLRRLGICLAAWTLAAPAIAETNVPRLLHNLSAGSRIVPQVAIKIPANEADVPLGSSEGEGAGCLLRMREAKPFERVLSPSHALTVEGTSRAGFTAPRRHEIDTTTYVELSSLSVMDFACRNRPGELEASVQDFERTISPYFRLELPTRAATEAD